jgi:hypothetical protein
MGGNMVMVDKAEAFRAEAEAAGWETALGRNGARVTVTAVRGPKQREVVTVTWEGNACLNESVYLLNGRGRKLRNAAAARRVLAQSVETATSKKATARNSSRIIPQPRAEMVDEEQEVERPKPPTWGQRHCSLPDREILKKVVGKEIIWINGRTKMEERATVLSSPDQRQLRIERNLTQRRVVTFAAKGAGFRSVYVDAIVAVK